MCLSRYQEAEQQLFRAYRFFSAIGDRVRLAQVDDTLSHLYLVTDRLKESESSIDAAIEILKDGDEDAILAEALITKGQVLCKRNQLKEGITVLERAATLCERCGDNEGAGLALLIMLEEAFDEIPQSKLDHLRGRLQSLLENSQRESIRKRLFDCLARISNHIERRPE